jgi:hypothetical protein
MKKYRPSNGSEGILFEENFCDKCKNETWNPETNKGKQCEILGCMMLFNINEPEYPSELVYKDDKPTCTAFKLPEPYKKPEIKIPGQMTF